MRLPAELRAASLVDDHPDSMRRLRRLVVALAITGRLTEKRGSTEASNELVRQLDARHQQLVTDGKLTRAPVLRPVAANNLPEATPAGPLYLRLGDVAQIEKGRTGISSALPGPYPLVVTAQDRASCDHFDFEAAAAIVPLVSSAGHGKASLQRLHYQDGKFALGSILAAVIPRAPELLSARFIYEYLTTFKDELLVARMIGTANVTLSVGKLADVPIPIISTDAQVRVHELMAQCDRMEAIRVEREAARDRLTKACLSRLASSDAASSTDDVSNFLDCLPVLTARSDQIRGLRDAVLRMAFTGRFSAAADWPPKPRRFGEVAQLQSGYAFKSEWFAPRGIRLLRNVNVAPGRLNWADQAFLPEEAVTKFERFRLETGDIVLSLNRPFISTGTKVTMIQESDLPALLVQRVARLRLVDALMPQYLLLWLQSSMFQEQVQPVSTNVAPHIAPSDIESATLLVPSMDEQQRLVRLTSKLLSLCQQLEHELSHTGECRQRLLDAVFQKQIEQAAATRCPAFSPTAA